MIPATVLLETAMLFTPFEFYTPEHQIRVQHNGVERTAAIVDDSYSKWRDGMHLACNAQEEYFAPVCHNTVTVLPTLTKVVYQSMTMVWPDCLRTVKVAVVDATDWFFEGYVILIYGGIAREELPFVLAQGWGMAFLRIFGGNQTAYGQEGCLG